METVYSIYLQVQSLHSNYKITTKKLQQIIMNNNNFVL
jgi:hypothetical protein